MTRRKGSSVPPVLDWVHPEHEELLLSSRLFERDEIGRRLREHVAGRQNHLRFLWALLVTDTWIQRYEARTIEVRASRAG